VELRFEHGDRVRLIVASCLTVAALPILLREGKEQRVNQPTVAAVAPGGAALASPLDSSPSSSVVAAGSATVASSGQAPVPTAGPADQPSTTADAARFLVGSPTTPDTAGSVTIAVPAPPSPTTETATASFKRWVKGSTWAADPCAAWFLKVGTRVTVTNLDNGHTASCTIVDRTGTEKAQVIVLDADIFAQLSDLVHAPIPVRISWR
jgi:hypothetical protein